jgi:hypothetical protein
MRDADNAAKHGVAIKTIRRWRRLYQRRGLPRGQEHTSARCPRCDGEPLDGPSYAELLGWYLGDGHISLGRRGVYALHIFNDLRYTELNAHVADLMRGVKPRCRPHTRVVPGRLITTVSWKHWPCLFPQHGPGRKHERELGMTAWQWAIVTDHPADFLRGLFHSDGCRIDNWATRMVAGEKKRYEYGRWQLSNCSEEIPGLVRRGARPARCALAAIERHERVGLDAGRRRPAGRAHRTEALISSRAGGRPP